MADVVGISSGISALLPQPVDIERYFDRLWPLCRSITGSGLRQSFGILRELIPLEMVEVPSGTRVFDWTIPKEWNIEDAWIENEHGEKILDFKGNNLHVLGYSVPVDAWFTLDELQNHLYSLPEQPEAIPYLTSYYEERWGFCLQHAQRLQLKPGKYRAVIRSTLEGGSLTYGHYVLPATISTEGEILLSTYLCHPSLANNELSGPLTTAFLYRALSRIEQRRFHYRFVVVPETIGTIAYLSRFGEHLKTHCKAGLVVNCCGDDKRITYKKTRDGDALIDRIVFNVLRAHGKPYEVVDFSPLGSDERQYCSPGFNLPVGSLMRSYNFPECHTSLDDKNLISFMAIRETIEIYLRVLVSFEKNKTYLNTVAYGEPMLSRHGLYPTLSKKALDMFVKRMMWVLNLSDGKHDLCAVGEKSGFSVLELAEVAELLNWKRLLRESSSLVRDTVRDAWRC